jgi:hypothetical protein
MAESRSIGRNGIFFDGKVQEGYGKEQEIRRNGRFITDLKLRKKSALP